MFKFGHCAAHKWLKLFSAYAGQVRFDFAQLPLCFPAAFIQPGEFTKVFAVLRLPP